MATTNYQQVSGVDPLTSGGTFFNIMPGQDPFTTAKSLGWTPPSDGSPFAVYGNNGDYSTPTWYQQASTGSASPNVVPSLQQTTSNTTTNPSNTTTDNTSGGNTTNTTTNTGGTTNDGAMHGVYATPGTFDYSYLSNQQTPTAPSLDSVKIPEWYNTYNQMYQNTFTNPQQYWDEYSQGVGAQNMEAAARGMAQSGRTGLLPTLQTDAYKSYMSDYLPTVREGIAKGLTYDQGMNQVLGNMYNNQLDYNKGIYGSQVSAYGAQLGLDQAKLSAISNAQDQNTKLAVAQLDSLSKQYGVDAQTQQQIYQTMSNMFPHMTTEDQNAFVLEMKLAMGMNADSAAVGQNQTQIPDWYKKIQAENAAKTA